MQLLLQRPLDYIRVVEKKGLRGARERGEREEGAPRVKGAPTGGCEAHSTNQTSFFCALSVLLPLSLYLSIKGCCGAALHRAIIVIRLESVRAHTQAELPQEGKQ